MSRFRFALLVIAVVLPFAFSPSARAGERGSKKSESGSGIAAANLVWPQPPQRRRIAYVGQITGVDDIKGVRKTSWMDRAAGAKPKAARARLQTPYGVAADSKGRIFVADPANRVVFVFDPEHREVDYRGAKAPAQFALPTGEADLLGEQLDRW